MEYAQIVTVSTEWVVENALSLLTAIIVLIVGWNLAGLLSRQVRNLLPHTKRIDQTIAPLISEVVRYLVIVVTIVIVLGQFGVQTASILAVLGAVGAARFFGQDAVARVGLQHRVDDGFFGGMVHLGHEVVVRLGHHLEALDVERCPVDDRPGCACSFDGDVEHGVQGLRHGLTLETGQ